LIDIRRFAVKEHYVTRTKAKLIIWSFFFVHLTYF
jgi:hypothetical protein